MNIKIFYRRNARRITARRCSDGSVRLTVPYGFDIVSNKSILDSLIERINQATASEPERKALFFDGCQLVLEGITFYINYTSKNTTTISATYQQLDSHTSGYIYVPHTLDFEDINTEKRISDMISAFVGELEKADSLDAFLLTVKIFYKTYGVGSFGIHKAFYMQDDGSLTAVSHIKDARFENIYGYESQKQKLIQNTVAFANGNTANNVLLYGDSGTGKSTSIKAVVNEFFEE